MLLPVHRHLNCVFVARHNLVLWVFPGNRKTDEAIKILINKNYIQLLLQSTFVLTSLSAVGMFGIDKTLDEDCRK